MTKRILGILLILSPFIAIALLPLYTDTSWVDVGIGFGIAVAVIGAITLGAFLIWRGK